MMPHKSVARTSTLVKWRVHRQHQQACEIENNPQFILHVEVPTDVKITLTQLDPDLLPAACYVITPPGWPTARNPARISEMNRDNVYASTGQPRTERELNCHTTLSPGTYVLYCATYMAMMEGSFRVSVTTNTSVEVKKLWPPADAAEGAKMLEENSKTLVGRFKQKVNQTAAAAGDKINAAGDKAIGSPGSPGSMNTEMEDD